MPIFARRVIQRLLNENRLFIAEDKVSKHVKDLNCHNNESIAAEWEVVILNVLSKIGTIEHEKNFPGSKKPDIYFESPTIGIFVADITVVSDESYNNENPVDYFYKCFRDYISKEGLTANGLDIRIESQNIGGYGNRKVKLTLPDKKDIPIFIKNEFRTILNAIKYSPNEGFNTIIKKESVCITVVYNPHGKFFSSGHACYYLPSSLINNPLYNRLKKKSEQLRKSKYEGIMGVFICDGGCNLLNRDFHSLEEYSQDKIIQEVFRTNTCLSFVFILTIEEKHSSCYLNTKNNKFIRGNFYENPKARFPVTKIFFEEFKQLEKHFPVPQSTPQNASHYIDFKKEKSLSLDQGLSHYGGFTMSGNEIKISPCIITELLAGTLKFEKFDEDYKNNNGVNVVKEFFNRQIQQGNVIESAIIEKCSEEDDDWITFKYESGESAISKFQ
jgi:hypothetical protein